MGTMRPLVRLGALAALLLLLLAAAGRRRAAPPGDASIYASPLVTPAPAPSQPANASWRFEDARGVYEHRAGFLSAAADADVAPYVNVAFTRAGHLRSGDLHDCEQLNHVLFGAATLTQRVRGRDVVSRHVGGDVVRIPPHVPHLYHFTQDTLLTETWRTPEGAPCAFRAWYYAPYRERISVASADKRFAADG